MSDLEILKYKNYMNIYTDTDLSNSVNVDDNILITLKQLNLKLGDIGDSTVSNFVLSKVGTGKRIITAQLSSSYKEDDILIYKKEEVIEKQTHTTATLYLCIADNTLTNFTELDDVLKYICIGSINKDYITSTELTLLLEKYVLAETLTNSVITKYNPDNIYSQKSVVFKFNATNDFELYYALQEVPKSTDIANTDYWKKINFKVDKASNDTLGIVKPDGVSIKIKEDGTIYSEFIVDLSNYYTKQEIDDKIKIVDEVKEYSNGISINEKDLIIYNGKLYISSTNIEQTTNWETDSINFIELSINVDFSNYYNKEEVDNKISEAIKSISISGNYIGKFTPQVYKLNDIVYNLEGSNINFYICKIDTTTSSPSLEEDFTKIEYVTQENIDSSISNYDKGIHTKVIQRYNPEIDYSNINTVVYRLDNNNVFELYRVKKENMPLGTQVTNTEYWEKINISSGESGGTGGETIINSFITELKSNSDYKEGDVVYYKGILYTVLKQITTTNDLDSDVKVITDFRKETVNANELKELEFDPLYCFDNTKTYTESVLVFDKDTLLVYKSKSIVPIGSNLSDTTYWVKVGNFSNTIDFTINGNKLDERNNIDIIDDSISSDSKTYSSNYINGILDPILEGIKTINVMDVKDDVTEYTVSEYLKTQNCKTVLSHYVTIQNKSKSDVTEDNIYTNNITFTNNSVVMNISFKKDEVQRYELHSKDVVITSTDNIKVIYEATIIPL